MTIVDYLFELSERLHKIQLVREKFLNSYSALMHVAFNKYPFLGTLMENRETVTITDPLTLAL